jgi:hypothetical protein
MPSDYNIGSGLTDQELRVASFWVQNRLGLRRAGYVTLIIIVTVLWGFSLWSLLDAFVISYPRESRIPLFISQNELTMKSLEASAPRPIQPSEVQILPTTDSRQDFLVEISNPNTQWWAEFTYRFDAGEGQTTAKKGYVLPGSSRFLTELGWKGDVRAQTATLVVDDIRWHRVDPKQVERDYNAFATQRLGLELEDVRYEKDLVIGTTTVGQSAFTLKNPTGFGYWAVDLTIILYRLDNPVAVTTITERELKPGETRPIKVSWFDNLSGITKTDIRTNINILDPKAYLPTDRF